MRVHVRTIIRYRLIERKRVRLGVEKLLLMIDCLHVLYVFSTLPSPELLVHDGSAREKEVHISKTLLTKGGCS